MGYEGGKGGGVVKGAVIWGGREVEDWGVSGGGSAWGEGAACMHVLD